MGRPSTMVVVRGLAPPKKPYTPFKGPPALTPRMVGPSLLLPPRSILGMFCSMSSTSLNAGVLSISLPEMTEADGFVQAALRALARYDHRVESEGRAHARRGRRYVLARLDGDGSGGRQLPGPRARSFQQLVHGPGGELPGDGRCGFAPHQLGSGPLWWCRTACLWRPKTPCNDCCRRLTSREPSWARAGAPTASRASRTSRTDVLNLNFR